MQDVLHRFRAAILACALSLSAQPLVAETMKEMFPAYVDWLDPAMADRFGAMEIHRGTQSLAAGEFELRLGDGYYVLLGDDAR